MELTPEQERRLALLTRSMPAEAAAAYRAGFIARLGGAAPEKIGDAATLSLSMDGIEIRAFPDRGEIIGWAGSDLMDAHKSIIPPAELLRHLKPGVTQIDREHDGKPVEGVTLAEVWEGKRAVQDPETGKKRMIEGPGVKIRCDLAVPAAKAFFGEFKSQQLRGLSPAFFGDEQAMDDWVSGKTPTIAKLRAVPLLSGVARPSNSGADVLELRSEPENEAPATPADSDVQTTAIDPMQARIAALRAELAALTAETPGDKPSDPPAAVPASSPETPPAPPVEDPRIAELTSRLATTEAAVTELRASMSQDMQTRAAATDTAIATVREDLAGMRQRSDEMIGLVQGLPGMITSLKDGLDAKIAALKAPTKRTGSPGDLEERAIQEQVAEIKKTSDQRPSRAPVSTAIRAPR